MEADGPCEIRARTEDKLCLCQLSPASQRQVSLDLLAFPWLPPDLLQWFLRICRDVHCFPSNSAHVSPDVCQCSVHKSDLFFSAYGSMSPFVSSPVSAKQPCLHEIKGLCTTMKSFCTTLKGFHAKINGCCAKVDDFRNHQGLLENEVPTDDIKPLHDRCSCLHSPSP